MNKDDIKKIITLKKEKKFDDIYKLYGRNAYLLVTPQYYVNRDKNQLLSDGRYFDLYEKYGEDRYNAYIKRIEKADIENELGIHPGFINFVFFQRCKNKLKTVRNIAINLGFVTSLFSSALAINSTSLIHENSVIYEAEIDEYNKEIEEYAAYINSLELSDLEIIIKIMNDMWSTIDGYNNPDEYDVLGYPRLALYNDGYGVCRNMADDFTARMNAINPEYEACNLIVYISDAEVNNIQRNIMIQNDTVIEEQDELSDFTTQCVTNVTGNHMVSCIKLKEDNILLIVDPTNPSIGVLKNGKIYMLSNTVSDGLVTKPIGQLVLGIESNNNYFEKIVESYTTSGDIETLKEKYGIESQNKVLSNLIANYDTDSYGIKH